MSTYRYPKGIGTGASSKLPSDAMSRGATTDFLVIYVLDTSDPVGGFNPFQFVPGGSTSWSGEGKKVNTIYLHMPNQIQSNYQITYNDVDMGVMGATAVQSIAGGEGVTAEGIQAAAQSLDPEVKANLLGTAIGAANSALGAGGGMTGNDIAVLTKRKAFNPYKENVFKSVPFRNHSFNIKMVPRNKEEAEEIRGIINALKFGMHPKFGGTGGGASGIAKQRWLDIPFSFGLEYKRMGSQSSQLLYKFMPSVLTSLNVDYTPDGNYVAGRSEGDFNLSGMAVNLQMTFKETKIITKDVLQNDTSITY